MMIFTRLELKNFKSHADTILDFNPGISLIVGENGAGKSSIFEAISFALFKSYTTKSINDSVRSNKNTGDKIQMIVRLSFVSNGIEYMVERTITLTKSGSKPTSSLYKIVDGEAEIIVSGNKEVDKEIEIILSMDSSTFLNAIHIRQGEIAELIDKTPAKRKKLIGKLLRLASNFCVGFQLIPFKNSANFAFFFKVGALFAMLSCERSLEASKKLN